MSDNEIKPLTPKTASDAHQLWTDSNTPSSFSAPRFRNISGMRFGKLITTEPTQERRRGSMVWKCICDCGNECMVPASALVTLGTLSCGCGRGSWAKKFSRSELAARAKLARSKVDYQKLCNANKENGILARGRKNPAGPSAAGPLHWKSKFWKIRSPAGKVIQGVNLNHLIRQNGHLFDAVDIVWKNHRCNASRGIRKLHEAHGHNCSWKGWVVVASFETKKDPMDRLVSPKKETPAGNP